MTMLSRAAHQPSALIARRRRGGGTLVEAVLVMSLLIMVSMGAAQYGYALYLKHALQEAASVAVRVAVLPNSTDAQVTTAVNNQMAAAGFSNLAATTTTSPATMSGVTTGTYVTVTVTASWSKVGVNPLPAGLGGFPANRTFSASMTMLHE